MRVAVLGASGSVGRRIVSRLLDHGHTVAAQTRDESRLADLSRRVAVHAFDPTDAAGYPGFLEEAEAVVFALGAPPCSPTPRACFWKR